MDIKTHRSNNQNMIHLFEFHSIRSSARDNRNAESTGKYWLIKVFEVLKNCQKDIILEGNIYLDEMYFFCNSKQIDPKKWSKTSRNIKKQNRSNCCF